MFDLHCHVLPIDDGPQTIDQSIELIEQSIETGFTTLCCTSHYKVGEYTNKKYDEAFENLKKEIKKRNIDIKIIKGNELYLTPEGLEHLKESRVNTIGDSNYILVEAIPGMTYIALKKAILKVKKMGYRPILAHVERYSFITKKELFDLKNNNIVIQVNIKSLKHKKEIYKWIQLGLVDILASDVHNIKYRNYDLKKVLDEIDNTIGIETRKKLICENPKKIIANEKLEEKINEEKITDNSIYESTFIKRFFKRLNTRRSTENSR